MKRRIISILLSCVFVLLMFLTTFAEIKFKDIIDTSWASLYINYLVDKGSIQGYPDGTFKPNNHISRAEFTKILVSSLGYNLENAENGYWASNYINKAEELMLILQSEFDNYNKNINRGEMARMITRAVNEDYPANINEYSKQIKDYSNIPVEFKEFTLEAYVKGIITGYEDGTFKYDRSATRAEASTMIVRLLDETKRKAPELIKDDVIVIDGQEINVEAKEIIKPFNDIVSNLKNVEGVFIKQYFKDLSKFVITYVPEGEAGLYNNTFRISFLTNKDRDVDVQYLGAMYNYDEKTYQAVKETLKVFYPKSYQTVFVKIKNTAEKKNETGYSYIDNRRFGAKYFEDRDTVSIYIGGDR